MVDADGIAPLGTIVAQIVDGQEAAVFSHRSVDSLA
jgi:hypothetical protein